MSTSRPMIRKEPFQKLLHRTQHFAARIFLGLVMSTAMIAPAVAGDPPNLVDDNRDRLGLATTLSTVYTGALGITLGANPLTTFYAPVTVVGRVLARPKIHNLYLDEEWNENNPDAPTTEQLDSFTQALVTGPYFDAAEQYGIARGKATFTGSHGRSSFCIPVQPISRSAEFVEILAWVTCEVSFNPFSPLPGLLDAISGVPPADDDTLYVVYLPRAMSIIDSPCGAYHFFGAAPKVDTLFDVPIAFRNQTFAFAVIQTRCAFDTDADAIRDHITEFASHEIIEAATDPLVGTGWINDSVVTGTLIDEIVAGFSNVVLDLKVGEVGDICEDNFPAKMEAPYFQKPTPPVYLPVDNPSLSNRISVDTYWSNGNASIGLASGCAPFVPSSTLTFGTPNVSGGARTFVTSSTPLLLDATDGGSGLGVASVSYRAFPVGTAAPDYTTQGIPAQFSLGGPDGRYEVDFFATGNNGLSELSHSIIAVLDNAPPVIGIASPNSGSPYTVNQIVAASYSCTDAGSGLATCVGSVANGSSIDTATVGSKSFTVNATDKLANASSVSIIYAVGYKICLAYDPTNASGGRAYLFRIQLCDANDVNVSNVNIVITATGVDGDPTKAIALASLNPGNKFLYGPGTAPGASYTYNLDTRQLTRTSHLLNFAVQGDPTPHSIPFLLK